MDLLRGLLKAAPDQLANLTQDADLDPLRDRDDFKTLVTDWEKVKKLSGR